MSLVEEDSINSLPLNNQSCVRLHYHIASTFSKEYGGTILVFVLFLFLFPVFHSPGSHHHKECDITYLRLTFIRLQLVIKIVYVASGRPKLD